MNNFVSCDKYLQVKHILFVTSSFMWDLYNKLYLLIIDEHFFQILKFFQLSSNWILKTFLRMHWGRYININLIWIIFYKILDFLDGRTVKMRNIHQCCWLQTLRSWLLIDVWLLESILRALCVTQCDEGKNWNFRNKIRKVWIPLNYKEDINNCSMLRQ